MRKILLYYFAEKKNNVDENVDASESEEKDKMRKKFVKCEDDES